MFNFFVLHEQINEQDPDVRLWQVRGEEGIVPRTFSQLHPLCPLPGRRLHHLRVHEADPPPKLVAFFFFQTPSESVSRSALDASIAGGDRRLTRYVLNSVRKLPFP